MFLECKICGAPALPGRRYELNSTGFGFRAGKVTAIMQVVHCAAGCRYDDLIDEYEEEVAMRDSSM